MPPKKQNRPNGAVMKPGNSTKSSPVNPAPVSKSNKRKSDESNATVNGVNGKRHKGTPDQQNGLPVNRKDWAYDELLRAAVEPLSTKDIDEWDGWVELESDPAFLSSMLADCGVRNVKVEELISMEDDNLVVLSQPFFGLIFLHECQAESDEEAAEDDEDSDDVWFANQTIENACATIALMNIIMNCPQVDLGPELQKFKDDTDELCSPLKGQALGSNSFIRKNHNSLARRIDVFNSDLNLQASLRKFAASKTRESPKKKKKKAASTEEPEPGTQGYHYVAYVEVNGWIWRLDGLKAPVKLGRVPDGENLISASRPYIQAHIAAFNDSVYFSLMVLSESPLSRTIAQLGQTVAHFDELSTRAGSDPQLAALLQASEQPRVRLGLGLRQYGLTPDILSNVQIDGDFHQKVTDPDADLNELYQLYMDLINEQKMLLGSHRDETGILNASRRTYDSRKHDALAMINRWVEAIGAHGKLEKFASGTLDATDVAGEQAAADVAAEANEAEEAEEEVEAEEAEEAVEANGANGANGANDADSDDDGTTLIDSDDPDA